jgi:hypothetical protein
MPTEPSFVVCASYCAGRGSNLDSTTLVFRNRLCLDVDLSQIQSQCCKANHSRQRESIKSYFSFAFFKYLVPKSRMRGAIPPISPKHLYGVVLN